MKPFDKEQLEFLSKVLTPKCPHDVPHVAAIRQQIGISDFTPDFDPGCFYCARSNKTEGVPV